MRLKKQTTTGAACRDCGKVPAAICLYVDPDLIGTFCPDCCFAWLLEALRSKRITMQQLTDSCKSLIDEMPEEQLLRLYVAFANEGLIKGDSN